MPKRTDIHKILVIGSGPIVIGQAAEFDYSGTQACLALREEGYEVVLINSNPATIMTDTDIADKVYMEPLNLEYVARIIRHERPDTGVLQLFGYGVKLGIDLGVDAGNGLLELGHASEEVLVVLRVLFLRRLIGGLLDRQRVRRDLGLLMPSLPHLHETRADRADRGTTDREADSVYRFHPSSVLKLAAAFFEARRGNFPRPAGESSNRPECAT